MIFYRALAIIIHFDFDQDVAFVFMNYLDRATAKGVESSERLVTQREFQLTAITALSLAIKLHGEVDTPEDKPVKVAMSMFVSLGRDQFTIEEMKAKELDVSCALNWHVNTPTPLSFITLLMKRFPESWNGNPIDSALQTFVFELAVYLAKLSLSDSSLSFQFRASELAQAAIWCAVDALEQVHSP